MGLNPGALGGSYLGETVMISSRDDLVVGGACCQAPHCVLRRCALPRSPLYLSSPPSPPVDSNKADHRATKNKGESAKHKNRK